MTRQPPSDRGFRFPSKLISSAVWIYHRFGLSVRDVKDLRGQVTDKVPKNVAVVDVLQQRVGI